MSQSTVLLSNLLSIAAAGLFSGAMIKLVIDDTLRFYLADQKFQFLVLVGGVLLSVIVFVRLLSLVSNDSDHHHHDHDHDHDHGAGEDHDHSHAPSLWRLIVLALPLMIIFLGVPRQGFSAEGLKNKLSAGDLEAIAAANPGSLPPGFKPRGEPTEVDYRLLATAGNDPAQRELWQSRAVRVIGQFIADPRFQDRYRLMRLKITCCAADAVPLSLTVLGQIDPQWPEAQWLEVTGAVDFIEVPSGQNRKNVIPVLYQLQAVPTEPRAYLQ